MKTSGSEKVKPSANTALVRKQETEAKCQLDAAGWLDTTHYSYTLTCVFRHLHDGYDCLNSNTVNKTHKNHIK